MRNNRKSAVKVLLATIVLTASMGMTSWAGWEQGTGENAGKWRYKFEGEDYVKKHENIPQVGIWIEDRDSEQKAVYFFDENGWLYTNTKVYQEVVKTWAEVNEKGQQVVDGQVVRMDSGSSESSDDRLTNANGWIHENGNTYYRFADGSYAKNSWLWLDRLMKNVEMCYYFDSNGCLLTNTTTPDGSKVNNAGAWYSGNNNTNPEQREVQSFSEDTSVISQEGYTRGMSNMVLYLLTHTMDENNSKYEIEKVSYNQFIYDDRTITTYYIKYKGAPVVAWCMAKADDKNNYYCNEVWDASAQRNAILCDMPDAYDYDKIKNLFEGVEPYYDWKGIGGAIISHSFDNVENYVHIGFDSDNNIKVDVTAKIS